VSAGWRPYPALPGSTVTGTLLQWDAVGDAKHAPRPLLAWLPPSYTDSAPFQHRRESTACASIPRNPSSFLLASARIESETTGFNRNPSYSADPERRYPVVYFHDGQNVFDAATSFSGEWGADEVLTDLAREGLEAIAIGIPNGGERRFHEYSPCPPVAAARADVPPGSGGGADAYVHFLTETVKPLVDATLRTLPGPESTSVIGSSMGGVVSLHALLTRPDVFGHAGLMSPAFWTGGDFALRQSEAAPLPAGRVWLDVGGRESDDPARAAAYRQDAARLAEHWQARGLGERLHFREDPQAIHHESAWRARLPAALRFLLTGTVTD
jgi:Predicted hydrolase of the alpha/beta superfamily